jgi:hypothetical protein
MKSWTKACWATLIAASFVAGAYADDAAIVRITDRPAPVPDPGPGAPAPAPGAAVAGSAAGPVAGAPCDGAACNAGACAGAGAGCWFNPTRGFQPYAAAPVYREAVVYYRYWPDKWYGDPGFNLRPMFPQVYMPTDTTQLGFYYARVPQWMPNPNMYPPAPRPADWHRHVIYAGGTEGGSCGVTSGVSVAPGPDGGTPVGTPSTAPASPNHSWPTVPAAPSPKPMPPSAMLPGAAVQPAAANGADEAPAQSADVPPAPAEAK